MPASREEIIQKVNATFAAVFEVSPDELTPQTQIFKDLGVDSLDIVDLMVELQRKFAISLRQSEDVKKLVTLNDVYDLIATLLAAKGNA